MKRTNMKKKTKEEPTMCLMETDRLLCMACYQDIQYEDIGDHDPSTWLHAIIPWPMDAVCACCHAKRPGND